MGQVTIIKALDVETNEISLSKQDSLKLFLFSRSGGIFKCKVCGFFHVGQRRSSPFELKLYRWPEY